MENDQNAPSGRIHFGEFEVDPSSHELLRSGRRVRLQEKSFLVLKTLLESPGRVVSREELSEALWPKGYFVDAERGLNTAVRRLREALEDSAERPRFVETLPRLGYRFIGAIEEPMTAREVPGAAPSIPSTTAVPEERPRSSRRGRLALTAVLVAGALALVATAVVRSRAARTATVAGTPASSPENSDAANELVARARYLRNHKRNAEAKQFVEKALELDPKNANALAGLALGLLGERKDEQARETARRALEIDPDAWEAHRALGVLARGAGDLAGAERHFRRSVEANPADYKSRNRLARHLLECGRFDEAREQIVETRRVAPDDPDVQNIWIEFALRTGDYEGAIRQGEIWKAVWEKQIPGRMDDAIALAHVGARRLDDALSRFRAIDPDDDLRVALVLGYSGRTAEARAILDAHEKEIAAAPSPADPGLAGAMAMAYIPIGDFDRAFGHLDRQVAARWFPSWLNCPLFHPIRRDRRWPAFEQRLEREFFSGQEKALCPALDSVAQVGWPRPAKSPSSREGS